MTPNLPAVTIIIEWENAIDVVDEWSRNAMAGLARELAAVAPRLSAKPRLMYLYDRNKVEAGAIERVIDAVAPQLRDLAELEIQATDGLTYYKLKNYGIAQSRTALSVMIDSDAIPQEGWLPALLEPFHDPNVMAVGGFTRLGHDDFLSRAMALSWIFELKGDDEKSERRKTIHVNNCAVRTEFFQSHPFPDLQAYKVQCVFWARAMGEEGFKYVRTAKAQAIHAPHPGLKFLVWRAWTAGFDNDFVVYHTRFTNRLGRVAYSFIHFFKKMARASYRILFRGDTVGMAWFERPFALIVPLGYFTILLAGEVWSSITRRFTSLPPFQPLAVVFD